MTAADFRKLQKYDLVVLHPDHLAALAPPHPEKAVFKLGDGVPVDAAAVRAALLLEGDGAPTYRTVVCRVEVPVGDGPAIQATIRSITRAGEGTELGRPWILLQDGNPVRFRLLREHVNAMGADDRLSTLLHNGDAMSMLAISSPATFLQLRCRWEWLPSHDPDNYPSVRDMLDRHRITDDAMLAMLEFRMLTTQRLREWIEPLALAYSRDKRRTAALAAGRSEVDAEVFASEARLFGGNIPGSTELRSDIDVNTYGDGTEFVVRQFNALFRARFSGFEPGSVLDVNVYAKDFLPSFGADSLWLRGGGRTLRIRPEFDHEFTAPEIEVTDASQQLTHGLAKLRRYMVDPGDAHEREASWHVFCAAFGVDGDGVALRLQARLAEARQWHLQWNHWVVVASATPGNVPAFAASDEGVYLASEAAMADLPRSRAMKAQNALYEHILKENVEPARMQFNLEKRYPSGGGGRLDTLYFELRDFMSKSLYFANEAYVTCGGVLQVVGGKQMKSRKVSDDYGLKPSFHNIAYSVHELIQSAVDQLADIHKEAHRDFAHHAGLGEVLLATGKYIHRLLNALKHMYGILWLIPEGPFTWWNSHAAPSLDLQEQIAWWTDLTNFAYGLEALKKTNLLAARTDIEALRTSADTDTYNARVAALPGGGAAFILAKKFNVTLAELQAMFPEPFLPGEATRQHEKDAKLHIAVRVAMRRSVLVLNAERTVRLDSAAHYYEFFNSLVQHAIEDYVTYLDTSLHIAPRLRDGALRPNCPVNARIAGGIRVSETPLPTLLTSSAIPDWLFEDDEYYEDAE